MLEEVFNLETLRESERAIRSIFRSDKKELKINEEKVVTFLTEAYESEDRLNKK